MAYILNTPDHIMPTKEIAQKLGLSLQATTKILKRNKVPRDLMRMHNPYIRSSAERFIEQYKAKCLKDSEVPKEYILLDEAMKVVGWSRSNTLALLKKFRVKGKTVSLAFQGKYKKRILIRKDSFEEFWSAYAQKNRNKTTGK